MKKMVLFLLFVLIATPAMAMDFDKLNYKFTPYIWATNMDGNVGVGTVTTDVSADFSDLLTFTDSALMFTFEANDPIWGFYSDFYYAKLSDSLELPATTLKAKATTMIIEISALYRTPDVPNLEMIFGGRYFDIKNTIQLVGFAEVDASDSWIDPLIGARYTTKINNNLSFIVRGDIGGFLEADLMWNLFTALDYQFSENISANLNYRYMDVDYSDTKLTYDVAMGGLGLGLSFRF